jgi:ABC-type transport system involved in cytochrome bd biosynthesis fused ATPase/permease subunit
MMGTERVRELVNRIILSPYSLWVALAILTAVVAGVVFQQYPVVLALSLPLSLFFFAVGLSGASSLAALRKQSHLQQENERAQRSVDMLQQAIGQHEVRLDALPEKRRSAIQNEYARRSNLLIEHDVAQRWKSYVNGGRAHE